MAEQCGGRTSGLGLVGSYSGARAMHMCHLAGSSPPLGKETLDWGQLGDINQTCMQPAYSVALQIAISSSSSPVHRPALFAFTWRSNALPVTSSIAVRH